MTAHAEGTAVIEVNPEGTGFRFRSPPDVALPPGYELRIYGTVPLDEPSKARPGFYEVTYRIVPSAGLMAWGRRHWWALNTVAIVVLALWTVGLAVWGWHLLHDRA